MKRAFTMVELLIYIGIVTILLTVLGSILISTFDVHLQSTGSAAVDHSGRYLMSRLAYDIHRASAVVTPATVGTTSDILALTIGGSTYTYATLDNQLQLTSPTGTNLLTSYDVTISDLSFTRLANTGGLPSIQISFTLSSTETTTNQVAQTRSYQTTLNLR